MPVLSIVPYCVGPDGPHTHTHRREARNPCLLSLAHLVVNQDVVRSDANLSGVDVLSEHDAPGSHLEIGALRCNTPPPGARANRAPSNRIALVLSRRLSLSVPRASW